MLVMALAICPDGGSAQPTNTGASPVDEEQAIDSSPDGFSVDEAEPNDSTETNSGQVPPSIEEQPELDVAEFEDNGDLDVLAEEDTSGSEVQHSTEEQDSGDDDVAGRGERKSRKPPVGPNVDEIVVTSQRRDFQPQELPVSVSTLDAETLDFHNIVDTNVSQLYAPNVNIFNEPTWSFISIRGMGSGLNAGFEQSVGIVLDYINLGKSAFLINSLLDAQTVEILRGPQGIIVAKNATAGAYVITSALPAHEWGGKYDVSAYQWEKENDHVPVEYSGVLTGPIIEDVVAFRTAFYVSDIEGQTYNSKLDRYQANDNEVAMRASLLWVVNPDLYVTIGVNHAYLWEDGPNHELAYVSDDYRMVSEPYGEVEDDQFNRRTSHDYPAYVERDSTIVSAYGRYAINQHSNFGVVVGYAQTTGDGSLDADWGPAPLMSSYSEGTYDQVSVEMNYIYDMSTAEEKDMQRGGSSMADAGGLLIGVLYFSSAQDGFNNFDLFPNGVDETLNALNLCIVSPLCDSTTLPVVGDGSHRHKRIFDQTTESYAVFGSGVIAVPWTERWLVSVGARYVYEEKMVKYASILEPQEGINLWPYFIPDTEDFQASRERSEDALTWRVTLQWFPISHKANYFVNAAKGWKAGGYNANAGVEGELEFDPETTWSIEAGAKVQFFGEMITSNLTFFYSEFDDLQTSTYNGEKFVVGNAASAFSQGAELEFWLWPWEDLGLIYSLQASLLEVRFADYKNGPCPAGQSGSCDRTGARQGGHLPWQAAMSLTYQEPLGDWDLDLVGQVSWAVRPNDSGRNDGDPKHEVNSLSWVNFRLGIKDADDRWHLSFICGICIGDGASGGFDVPIFPGTHAHIPVVGPGYQIRLYGYF